MGNIVIQTKKIQNQYMGTQKKYGMVFEVRSSCDYSQ